MVEYCDVCVCELRVLEGVDSCVQRTFILQVRVHEGTSRRMNQNHHHHHHERDVNDFADTVIIFYIYSIIISSARNNTVPYRI
jgi:UDP-N-acetylmuramyl pentapeptide phosphotransferase/UDP-N-acetylglucosamine-1-phosphate transferase